MPKIRVDLLDDDMDLPDETYDWLVTLETKKHKASTVKDEGRKKGNKKVTRKRGKDHLYRDEDL